MCPAHYHWPNFRPRTLNLLYSFRLNSGAVQCSETVNLLTVALASTVDPVVGRTSNFLTAAAGAADDVAVTGDGGGLNDLVAEQTATNRASVCRAYSPPTTCVRKFTNNPSTSAQNLNLSLRRPWKCRLERHPGRWKWSPTVEDY